MNPIRKLRSDEPLPTQLLLLADESMEMVNRYIDRCEIFVYEQDNQLVGEIALERLSATTIEIKNIAVDERLQGKGIGKQLLQYATNHAVGGGYHEITIGTGDVSFKQLDIYQRAGFEMFAIKPDFYLQSGYKQPLLENGLRLKHMVMLRKKLV
jgi:N-acetylglutamate synthase-like GNAT family acetyltransferase